MVRPKTINHRLALLWVGNHYQVVLCKVAYTKWMKKRCQSAYTFVRDNDRVEVIAVDHPCDQKRAQAFAQMYLVFPESTIDSLLD